MNRRPLLADGLIAVAIAVVVLLVSPGVAIVAVVAIVVLLAWSVDALVRRRRWKRRPPRRG